MFLNRSSTRTASDRNIFRTLYRIRQGTLLMELAKKKTTKYKEKRKIEIKDLSFKTKPDNQL